VHDYRSKIQQLITLNPPATDVNNADFFSKSHEERIGKESLCQCSKVVSC